MSRMMVYAWFDQDNQLKETKFGDHFVTDDMTEQDAVNHTLQYIRTQFPRRGKHFDSGRILCHVWDASEVAKKYNKFYGASKIDDVIRTSIRFPGTQGKEFHALEINEVISRVNKRLTQEGQPLPSVGLSKNQYDAAENTLAAFSDNKKTIMAELCARFGKTIWSGAIVVETGILLTIVATYIKTSFSSFEKELTSFSQFSNLSIVDSEDPDWKLKIEENLKNKKQVVVFLSMCNGSKRQDRIDYLFTTPCDRLLIVDEADFGVHQKKQSEPLIKARKENDKVILMTGTNADRASSSWKIDHYLSVTYPELIIEKKNA